MRNIVVIVIALVAIAAAWFVVSKRQPQTEIERTVLLPGLLDEINTVSGVEIRSTRDEVRLARTEAGWVVASSDGYPADFERIKRAMIELAEARVVEPKTSNPERFERIGLRGLDDPESRATQVVMRGPDGTVLSDLLIGDARSGSAEPGRYVRASGTDQTYLVTGTLDVPAAAREWMDRGIMDIQAPRVVRVEITPAEGPPYTLVRRAAAEDAPARLALAEMPEGYEDKSPATTDSIGTFLGDLRFDAVRAAEPGQFDAPASSARFVTREGIEVTVETIDEGEDTFARFLARHEPELAVPAASAAERDDAAVPGAGLPGAAADAAAPPRDPAAEAASIAGRTDGWAYRLPSFKVTMITRARDQLIQPARERVEAFE